ncbi:hypothetical protein [Halalkalibacter lacteus]|uniref:hypothetical protein n=1 Tax=Halalkalibacter lacteus TaxID=3090663 RepID=UPI002FC79BD5
MGVTMVPHAACLLWETRSEQAEKQVVAPLIAGTGDIHVELKRYILRVKKDVPFYVSMVRLRKKE